MAHMLLLKRVPCSMLLRSGSKALPCTAAAALVVNFSRPGLQRNFSGAAPVKAPPEPFVPVKTTPVDELPPAEWAKMNEDLDGVYVAPHFRTAQATNPDGTPVDWRLPHPVWSSEEVNAIRPMHTKPKGLVDWAAYGSVMGLRRAYDFLTGYTFGFQNEACMIRRVIFLETIAGVPGMVGAAARHLRSLRTMERDYGWIHTLLEEAENERMHLMTAMLLRKPSVIIRATVMAAQAIFVPFYVVAYALSPRFCHRFVGYLEEQAVNTYSNIVNKIDMGDLPGFEVPAPTAINRYWRLPEGSTLRDVFLAIRADEDHHREVNHTFAALEHGCTNPFPPGY